MYTFTSWYKLDTVYPVLQFGVRSWHSISGACTYRHETKIDRFIVSGGSGGKHGNSKTMRINRDNCGNYNMLVRSLGCRARSLPYCFEQNEHIIR